MDISLSVSPIRDRAGRLVGASKVARDVTQRKQAEETHRLLLGELNHRVKNTLATVQAIANQTLRVSPSPAEFIPSFLGRLHSLANAHTLLTQTNWQGADLNSLIHSQVLIDSSPDERVRFSGPQVSLDAKMALQLALVLHELGTNARKHGALSNARGQVSISWSVESQAAPVLRLVWQETGGPPVYFGSPMKSGFGTFLIDRSIRVMAGGEANVEIEATGLSWRLAVPLPQPSTVRWEAKHVDGPARAQSHPLSSEPVPRVLVVEDEPLVSIEIAGVLGQGGFHVIGPVASTEAALLCVYKDSPDAALIDANLAGRPVDEVAAALTRKSIPFAFVTGYGRESLPLAFAAAPVLSKPFLPASLIELTRRLLSREGVVPLRRDVSD